MAPLVCKAKARLPQQCSDSLSCKFTNNEISIQLLSRLVSSKGSDLESSADLVRLLFQQRIQSADEERGGGIIPLINAPYPISFT